MDELMDFEEFIDINEVIVSIENLNGEFQEISEEPLIDALDQMCDDVDENETTTELNDVDKNLTIEEAAYSSEDVNLDEFENIFNEMRMSTDTLDKLGQKDFSINDLESEIFIQPANENGIAAELIQVNDEIADIANLDEFETIFDEVCLSNNRNEIEKKDSMLSEIDNNVANIDQNEDTGTDLDKIADKVNDLEHHVNPETNSLPEISTASLKQEFNNLEEEYSRKDKEPITVEVNYTDHSSTDTVAESKEAHIIYVSSSEESENYACNNSKEDKEPKDIDDFSTATVVESKAADIIYISSSEESEDDGYNSSDFEFITESEAKKECLSKTTLDSGRYYNSDYMKYHKLRLQANIESSRAKRQSHVIPQGGGYLDLFRGMYGMNDLLYATNKIVLPATSMSTETDGYGFNIFENKDEEDNKYKGEVDETKKKILFLYPQENRKRRRF